MPDLLLIDGGLIPAAVAAVVFCLGALATRRLAWSRAAWSGVAIAVGFVSANVLLGEAAAPWIPRLSRDWLPTLALAGGADGMDFIRRLLRQAPQHLNPEGLLVLEIGHERAHFEAAYTQLQPLWLSTSAGDDQMLLLAKEQLK